MKLQRYFQRLENTIHSRGDIEIEQISMELLSAFIGHIWGRLRFYDGSLLEFEERVRLIDGIEKTLYRYHYQRADGALVFRYDNAPHYPGLPNFPHHKHIGEQVEPARPPDLSEVLREIDELLYEE
ncbi:MAG TPA: hypothetical protein ENG33_06550 [Chloroflexi bacterium]|nr:hypothetical protein [Chloroflexota bacterium]